MTVSLNNNANGAGGGVSVYPGEVRTFAEGAVPDSFTQVSGPSTPPSANSGVWTVDNLGPRLTATTPHSRIAVALGRIFMIYSQSAGTTGVYMQELDGNYNKVGQPVVVPLINYNYNSLLIPLANGNLIRMGGSGSALTTGDTARYNVSTKTFSTLSTKPAANISYYVSKAAQAGDGNIYGSFNVSTAQVDMFNPNTNAWTENVVAAPAVASSTLDIVLLPSGKLLWVTTTAQYVFDPAAKTFTQVGSFALSYAAAVQTATGARIYHFGGTNGAMSSAVEYSDYTEATTTLSALAQTNVQRPWNDSSSHIGFLNPLTGGYVLKGLNSTPFENVLLTHTINYKPLGTVQATKKA